MSAEGNIEVSSNGPTLTSKPWEGAEAGAVTCGSELGVVENKTPARPIRRSMVHFSDDEDSVSSSADHNRQKEEGSRPMLVVELEDVRSKSFSVYIGMLKEGFTYSVEMKFPLDQVSGCLKNGDVLEVTKLPTVARAKSYCCTDGFLWMELEIPVRAGWEWNRGEYKDEIRVCPQHLPNWNVSVEITAKILRVGMGTATLREGVRRLGILTDEEPVPEPEAEDGKERAEGRVSVSSDSD